jgi:hypothetical protein
MGDVSTTGQYMMSKIIEWELLGAEAPINPHRIMRDLSDRDLKSLWDNVQDVAPAMKTLVSYQVVELEMLYRQGLIDGDWKFVQEGSRVRLSYSPIDTHRPWARFGPRMTA